MAALNQSPAASKPPAAALRAHQGALVLIGFMGAGKTTAAARLAGAVGTSALDSDRVLEERLGHSVTEHFEQQGEDAFRRAEEELVLELLGRARAGTVLSLGGGSVLSPRVRMALGGHLTILLDVEVADAWERVTRHPQRRPLARDQVRFAALHEQRRGVYRDLADAILPARSPDTILHALGALAALAQAPSGTRMLWATGASSAYPVFLGRGVLGSELWPCERSRSRTFCVSDEHVAPIYGARLPWASASATIPAGERHKTLASAEHVWRQMVRAGITRADHVAALGGGVVGDLAGFCAATYQRGIPVVQLPTTLVAQVDSAYGGKTGLDLAEAKNYVGVYHQPAGVIVDPGVLDTLPAAEYAAGQAEVIKTALIAGGALWRRVSEGGALDDRTILDCVQTKLSVVSEDERDAGQRQVLNLGHTVGHALETATGYGRYRHGEAVGLGLLAALRLSGQEQLRSRVGELLQGHGLPTRVQGAAAADIILALQRDKKRVGERVPFVLVQAPGEVHWGAEVKDSDLRRALAELGAQ